MNVFEQAMANPLRSTVMYPPDRSLFARFHSGRAFADVLADARSPLGVYVHIPYCETKCSYCDYETVPLAGHDAQSIDGYVDAIVRELERAAAALPPGLEVTGLDFGGGTPGVLTAAQIARVLRAFERHFRPATGFEVSIETTPTLAAADPGKWRAIREAGVARVSMGVQTFEPALLGRLHRALHVEDRVARGMEALRDAGFAMVNLDLMFALPGLSLDAWRATVERAITLAPDVITLYDTVYKNRGIATQAPRWNAVPSPADFGAQYDAAFGMLTRAGFSSRYGSVNFSRVTGRLGTSRYLESRLLDGDDYLGLGLYASSRIGDAWRFGRRRYAGYRGDLSSEDLYDLPREHVIAKFLLLALSYGYLDAARYRERFGETIGTRFTGALPHLRRCTDGFEMIEGTFDRLPGIRAGFWPEDALRLLGLAVLRAA